MTMSSDSPKASVITAAYNRSNVLYYAIESVRRQTCEDWEHIVVGDHCTDDTEAVVARFNDPRIRFVNLPQNSGGQSAPHNHALSMARGRYLFYLNQDDFFFPDHIASSIACLERSGADIVWSPAAVPLVSNRNSDNLDDQPVALMGVTPNGYFDASVFMVSSSWALRAGIAARMGPWKQHDEILVSPSQELLFRAWKRGCKIQFHPHVSVFMIQSGSRRNSYALREVSEHERYFDLVYSDPHGRAKLMERVAVSTAIAPGASARLDLASALRNLRDLLVMKASGAIGIHPNSFDHYYRYRRDGGLIAWHRKQVLGVPSLGKGDIVRLGDNAADGFLGFGWSRPEGTHRWMESRRGQVSFRLDKESPVRALAILGRPVTAQTVKFQIDGQAALQRGFGDGMERVEIPLSPASDLVVLTIEVSRTVRPKDVEPGSDDTRSLAFAASHIELI
jgi:hypothetical protein